MIIKKRSEVFYCVEMTEMQAVDLYVFLGATTNNGHVNELAVQAKHGKERADSVHETLDALREVLKNK